MPVINVWCVAVYVSNHNSSVKSTLPVYDRHVWAHRALQCLLLYKADFKYSHFRGDAPQWNEANRLNRSTAPTPPSHSLSLGLTFSEPPLAFCFIVTRHSKSWLEYQRDNFLTVSLYLSVIALIRWFSLPGFVLSRQSWLGWVSSSSLPHFVFPSLVVLLSFRPLCTHITMCTG